MDTLDISIGLYWTIQIVFNQKMTENIQNAHAEYGKQEKISKKREGKEEKKSIYVRQKKGMREE